MQVLLLRRRRARTGENAVDVKNHDGTFLPGSVARRRLLDMTTNWMLTTKSLTGSTSMHGTTASVKSEIDLADVRPGSPGFAEVRVRTTSPTWRSGPPGRLPSTSCGANEGRRPT
jgi:hypothetical protein